MNYELSPGSPACFSSLHCTEIPAMGYSKLGKYPISSSYSLYRFLDYGICREVDCRFRKGKTSIPRKKYMTQWKVRYFPWLDLREQIWLYFNIFCKYTRMQEYSIAHDNLKLPCININQKKITCYAIFKYQNFYHPFLKLDNIFTEWSWPLFKSSPYAVYN